MNIFKPDKAKIIATIVLFVVVVLFFAINFYRMSFGVPDVLVLTPPAPPSIWETLFGIIFLVLGSWPGTYVETLPLPLAIIAGTILILAYQYVVVCLVIAVYRKVVGRKEITQ